jgi:hypothetical protein
LTSTDSSPVTMTAACETGTHRCKGVVLSLTTAHGQPCSCSCHGSPVVRDLPATFAELVFTYPPCDGDVDLAPIEDEELDDLLDREADRRLDQVMVDELFGAEL